MIAKITDHAGEAVARIPSRWYGLPNFEALVRAFVAPIQTLEDALWELLTLRTIDTGSGITLDAIGEIIGEPRTTQTDDEYRPYLRARIATNCSDGTVEALIRVCRVLLNDPAVQVRVRTYPPASIVIRLRGAVPAATADALIGFLRSAKAAGVSLMLVSSTVDRLGTFRFARAGYSTQINAAASVANLGLDYEAHPDVPSTAGYAALRGTTAAGVSKHEVIAYGALNRNTTPDRYDSVDPTVANAYDGWPTYGAAEVRPLFDLPATGFGATTGGPFLIPAGQQVTVGDDVVGDATYTVPAGTYSITVLADMLTTLARALVPGFSYTAVVASNEISTTYAGPGTEFTQDATAATVLGIATVNSVPPGTVGADGPISTDGSPGGVWARARV